MATLLTVNATLEEHFAAAGAKDPTAAAAILKEEEIESIQALLDIEESILLETLTKICGIKAGSATRIHAYCQQ